MSKKAKLQKIKLSNSLKEYSDVYDAIDDILDYETLEDVLIENGKIEGINNLRIKFNGCIFRNIVFENCDFRKRNNELVW